MRISDWSSDVCSSDLRASCQRTRLAVVDPEGSVFAESWRSGRTDLITDARSRIEGIGRPRVEPSFQPHVIDRRSEEHTSELQSLMRISYAVFCLKTKKMGKWMSGAHYIISMLSSDLGITPQDATQLP